MFKNFRVYERAPLSELQASAAERDCEMKTNKTKAIAFGSMLTAACTVLMLLGAVLEIGMYAAPLFAGIALIPYGEKFGRKYQLIAYAAVSLLSFLLVPNIEQNLMFAGFFGWYPMLRYKLQKLPKALGMLIKLLVFNTVIILIEALVMFVLVPEVTGSALLIVLLLLGNITFIAYEYMIPNLERYFRLRFKGISQ